VAILALTPEVHYCNKEDTKLPPTLKNELHRFVSELRKKRSMINVKKEKVDRRDILEEKYDKLADKCVRIEALLEKMLSKNSL